MQELSGGPLIQQLMDDTNHFAERYPELRALRARIAWAESDDIVTALPYRYDAEVTFLGTEHLSVCKPTRRFVTPFKFICSEDLSDDGGVLQ